MPDKPNQQLSKRGEQWLAFSKLVLEHIENYTVPQYGDLPDDQAAGFNIQDIAQNIKRYQNRAQTNARGTVESRRDCLKTAHYACIMYDLL